MDVLHDRRIDCHSVQISLTVDRYLGLAKTAHDKQGGIAGQRDVLKTTTAKRIRERMIGDIRKGAVLPPVVLGAVVSAKVFDQIRDGGIATDKDFLDAVSQNELTIIDGMQRTAALQEAASIDSSVKNSGLRVEFWLAKSVRSLVYRMLVLNTGQVPWTLARQLSVVYAPLLTEIRENVPNIEKIFFPEKPGRRVSGGQYSSDSIVEIYLAFSLRKTSVDTRETLSEEFSRLDFVDNLSDDGFQRSFYAALGCLVDLDKAFDRYDPPNGSRFSRGRDVFGGQPARIGFIVAIAQHVLGRPGLDRQADEREVRMRKIVHDVKTLSGNLEQLGEQEVGNFLCLDVLSEILDKRVGQVGRYERNVFFEAFKVLIEEEFLVRNMEPCWRAS